MFGQAIGFLCMAVYITELILQDCILWWVTALLLIPQHNHHYQPLARMGWTFPFSRVSLLKSCSHPFMTLELFFQVHCVFLSFCVQLQTPGSFWWNIQPLFCMLLLFKTNKQTRKQANLIQLLHLLHQHSFLDCTVHSLLWLLKVSVSHFWMC